MPHDPEKVSECRAWLDRAFADLESARILLAADPARVDTALFHCQQAVEKAWKAFLFWHDVPFRRTHDLREVGEAAANVDPSLRPLVEKAEDLTPFAWLFRYPGEPEEPTREEAEEAFMLARQAYEAVLARLPDEVPP
ncbi:MAG: HEPN domain-containing protein [Planctomycetota bacterium]